MSVDSKPVSIYYPEESLSEKFDRGEMDPIYRHLVDFIERHREEILSKIQHPQSPEDYFTLLYQEIERRGSIHLPSEMADQIKEINKEIWYRGEDGLTNRRHITEEWTQRYSIMWRQARKMEILYVLRRRKDELLNLINKNRQA